MMRTATILASGALVLAACAVRLGGRDAVEYRVLALDAGGESDAAAVAARVRGTGANVVLLAAPRDTAWFAGVARDANLSLSGPGMRGGNGLALLATEPLGDTTLALPIGEGDSPPSVLVQDALYEVDGDRYLDLIAVRIDRGQDVSAAVGALLAYVATDVMPRAAVALAVDAPDAGAAERVARLLEPAFMDAQDCIGASEDGYDGENGSHSRRDASAGNAPPPGLLLFYGPELQMRCERAELRSELGRAIIANLVVNR